MLYRFVKIPKPLLAFSLLDHNTIKVERIQNRTRLDDSLYRKFSRQLLLKFGEGSAQTIPVPQQFVAFHDSG